eukprot:gene1236-1360_t
MPGANCSIYDCSTARGHKGISIFKVPGEDDEFSKKWRSQLINIVTKDRVIDKSLRKQIDNRSIHICEQHFTPDQINFHRTRKTLKPGVLPTLLLPVKSVQTSASSNPNPRQSADAISNKKIVHQNTSSTCSSTVCYKSFDEFCARAKKLKLYGGWLISQEEADYLKIVKEDGRHELPVYEIYIDDSLGFTIRVFGWLIPNDNDIYMHRKRTMQNITLSNLINLLDSQIICNGVSQKVATKSNCKILKHCVPREFSVFGDDSEDSEYPLAETVFYRHPSCEVLTDEEMDFKCNICFKFQKKETKFFAKLNEDQILPAKLNAPITTTNPQKVRLALKEYRLENKALKQELQVMKREIESKSLPISESLNGDFEHLMSTADKESMPQFMKLFWQEQQKYLRSTQKGIRYHPLIIRYCLSLAAKSPAASPSPNPIQVQNAKQ